MKKLIALIIFGMCLTGCNANTKSAFGESNEVIQEDNFSVAIKDCNITVTGVTKSKDNKSIAFIIQFENNSQETKKFTTTVTCKAFQNGTELKGTLGPIEHSNSNLEIKPGASIETAEAYTLQDDSSITLEFREAYKSEVVGAINYSIK